MGGAMPQNCPYPCGDCRIIHDGKTAQLCPVCKGAGGHYDYNPSSTAVYGGWNTCRGCGGKGWVTV